MSDPNIGNAIADLSVSGRYGRFILACSIGATILAAIVATGAVTTAAFDFDRAAKENTARDSYVFTPGSVTYSIEGVSCRKGEEFGQVFGKSGWRSFIPLPACRTPSGDLVTIATAPVRWTKDYRVRKTDQPTP